MNSAATPIKVDTIGPVRPAADAEPPSDAALATLPPTRTQIEARGLALGIVAVLAAVFALSWAQAFVVPLLLGIVIAYTLNPLVGWLEAIRVPRVLGTVVVMASVIGALGDRRLFVAGTDADHHRATAGSGDQVRHWSRANADRPDRQHAKDAERRDRSGEGNDQATGGPVVAAQPATHVIVDKPKIRIGNFLWENSMGALGAIGQAAMVVFLVFFLLLGGDTFKRKLVRLTGPSLSKRKITVQILDDINASIQKYMLMLLDDKSARRDCSAG